MNSNSYSGQTTNASGQSYPRNNEQNNANPDDDQGSTNWKRPGRSQRRRYRYYLGQGLSELEAFEKSKVPMTTPTTWKEGYWSYSSTAPPPRTSQKSQMRAKTNHENTTSKSIQIRISPKNYPVKLLDTEEANQIRNEVLKLIVSQRASNNVKPLFTQTAVLESGSLIFHCSDEGTASWLKEQDLWNSLDCDAVRKPACTQVMGYFKNSAENTTDFIFGMIEAQNHLLCTGWKQLKRQDYGTMAVLSLEVDPLSWYKLEQLNFKIIFGFGQKVHLKPRDRNLKDAEGGDKSGEDERIDSGQPDGSQRRNWTYQQ
ncbi:uncharacterized protein LOC131690184 [Topomyia yanbarensis]|uniref:uncharacterized protein LOC131690184 n=1 Tax=Topomyia yanbarensis TaxID=2498891 RepID=UPI00273BBD4B|nr:uncharacterized protein LOC131690184 [Topomyia yanbarensis]